MEDCTTAFRCGIDQTWSQSGTSDIFTNREGHDIPSEVLLRSLKHDEYKATCLFFKLNRL